MPANLLLELHRSGGLKREDQVATEEMNQRQNQLTKPVKARHLLQLCCRSGCTICVLDYPELMLMEAVNPETLAMLEAMEHAEELVERIKGEAPAK